MVGVDTDAVLRARGVSPGALDEPDGRIPFGVVIDLLTAATERGIDSFGLRIGSMGQWGMVVDYLARESRTLGQAWERMVRYSRIVVDSVDVALRVDGDTATLGGVFPLEKLGLPVSVVRQGVELWTASFVSLPRLVTEEPWKLREVCFSYERPADTSAAEEFFDAPLRFGTGRTQIVVDASVLDVAVNRSDTQLARILERHCDELMAKLPDQESLLARVHRAIAASLASGDPGLGAVADQLGTTARTLQRRLSDAGTSHKQLLDDMRRDLALRYLKDPNLAVSEAALLLGYSETSAFHRAFKRWTGQSPSDFRRSTA